MQDGMKLLVRNAITERKLITAMTDALTHALLQMDGVVLILPSMPSQSALKTVGMGLELELKTMLIDVMMETLTMETVAQLTVGLKMDTLVLEPELEAV